MGEVFGLDLVDTLRHRIEGRVGVVNAHLRTPLFVRAGAVAVGVGKGFLAMTSHVHPHATRLVAAPCAPSETMSRSSKLSPTTQNVLRGLAPMLTLVAVIGLWQSAVAFGNLPAYILPQPATVFGRIGAMLAGGTLQPHIMTTLTEAALGLVAAAVLAGVLAYPLARSRVVSIVLAPLLAATQAVPLVAVAPLLVIWFGFGITPKIVTCALIVFFPLLLNAVNGLKNVDVALIEAAQIFGANRRQTLWYVELPLALPAILTGTKIGFTLSFTGAVVGEFVTADSGLGYLLNLGRGQFDTPLVFVALLTLATIATLSYALVSGLEKLLVTW